MLYNFCSQPSCSDGVGPLAGLIADNSGALYGTTSAGGSSGNGTVFKLTPAQADAARQGPGHLERDRAPQFWFCWQRRRRWAFRWPDRRRAGQRALRHDG
jgi:uncharacterized repeat protein (TIGR03803 family)